ncbi:hypothetical protein H5410_040476 [Solanum commersonii]|uniref:Uncharacterized protein n=1 Tax=Solanum commersonii TaxID=4109 RepID=A0A9J5XQ94_SOLCO|nr:hypothetical protein H5410_040476 [Solanum commersonii]
MEYVTYAIDLIYKRMHIFGVKDETNLVTCCSYLTGRNMRDIREIAKCWNRKSSSKVIVVIPFHLNDSCTTWFKAQVFLYMLNIVARSLVPPSPHPTVDDNDLVEDESFGDHSMNMNVHPNGIGRA